MHGQRKHRGVRVSFGAKGKTNLARTTFSRLFQIFIGEKRQQDWIFARRAFTFAAVFEKTCLIP